MSRSSINKNYSSAFGLIETLIAVTILMFVLLGSVALAVITLRNMVIKAQTVQATNLARTGLETVRNIRDNVWINKTYTPSTCKQWDCWVSPTHDSQVNDGGNYTLRTRNGRDYLMPIASPGTEAGVNLILGSQKSGLTTANYKNQIKIRTIRDGGIAPFTVEGSGQELKLNLEESSPEHQRKIYIVESEVTFSSYNGDHTVVLTSYLSDWLPRK